jgi:hypothetical protein
MRGAFLALGSLAFLLGSVTPSSAGDIERMLQGGFGGYKYMAKERLKINYNNDFQQVAHFFDHNPDMLEGTPMCYGLHLVPMGSRRQLKRSRIEGFLATAERTFEYKRINVRYNLIDPDTIVPGFSLMYPDFDMDILGWDQIARWEVTKDGSSLSQIYGSTQGANVLNIHNIYNRGRETPGDYVIGGCSTFLGHHNGRETEDFREMVGGWITSAAIERRQAREAGHPEVE